MKFFVFIAVCIFVVATEGVPFSNFSNRIINVKDIDWGKVGKDFGVLSSSVTQATDSWQVALDLIKDGSSILGPISSVVSFTQFLIGLGGPGPDEAVLEKLEQLEKTLMDAFQRLGEKMDAGFYRVLLHIDHTDYKQKVIDEIRPLWDKFSILSKHPNMTDALHKFVKACDAHKPEETIGNMYERINVEPSILTSLKKATFYAGDSFESFSSSALQQMIQLETLFGHCELIANNLTDISQSSSTEYFQTNLKKIANAISESETELKDNFLHIIAPKVVQGCIDTHDYSDKGLDCIRDTMNEKFSWTNFDLKACKMSFKYCDNCAARITVKYSEHVYMITDNNRSNLCEPCEMKCAIPKSRISKRMFSKKRNSSTNFKIKFYLNF